MAGQRGGTVLAEASEAPSRRELARQAILATARELVALRGPHAATVRDITEGSGANVAAVNYYFQSKDDLLRQAMADIVGEVNAARETQLATMRQERDGGALTPRQILRALIEPILSAARAKDGGSLYLRLVQQIRVNPADSFSTYTFGRNDRVARLFLDAMAATFPALDRPGLVWHYEFARGAAVHLLANLDPLSRRLELLAAAPGEPLPDTQRIVLDQAAVSQVIDLLIGGFGRA